MPFLPRQSLLFRHLAISDSATTNRHGVTCKAQATRDRRQRRRGRAGSCRRPVNVEPGSGNGNHGIVTHTAVVPPASTLALFLFLSLLSSLLPRSLYLFIYSPASVVRILPLIFQPAQPCRSYLARWQDTSVRIVPDLHRHHHYHHHRHSVAGIHVFR